MTLPGSCDILHCALGALSHNFGSLFNLKELRLCAERDQATPAKAALHGRRKLLLRMGVCAYLFWIIYGIFQCFSVDLGPCKNHAISGVLRGRPARPSC